MIIEEQFKNLKPGDTLVLKITAADITLGRPYHNGTNCLFKEGDIVKPKENIYLEPYAEESLNPRDRYVVERVLATGWLYVSAENEPEPFEIWAGMLELVTPVEEREPYSVHESEVIQGFDIVRDKSCVMTFPFGEKENGWYHNRLAAKAAAETERDRLNAEWKKLQAYGYC